MEIDIIIPTFNDAESLPETLMSIGKFSRAHVIVVDDCSKDKNAAKKAAAPFEHLLSIEIFRTKQNSGPGGARNLGLEHAKSEAVMFLDCGDLLASPVILRRMLKNMEDDGNIMIMSPAAWEEAGGGFEEVGAHNNRCHGKVYRRDFLRKFNIRFNEGCSKVNEDIGLNMLCRLLCEKQGGIFETSDLGVIQTENPDSIIRRNENEFSFRQSNLGTAKNAVFAFERARKFGVSEEEIAKIGYNVMCFLYTSYISTLNMRPEFTAESFFGAVYFYHYYFGRIPKINENLLLNSFNSEMAGNFANENWFSCKINTLPFPEFLEQLRLADENTEWGREF